MAKGGLKSSPPSLATWADVDPARYPFDPVEMPVAVRALVPPPPARPAFRDGRWIGEAEAFAWVDSISETLSDRYGQWAYRWYWGPWEREQLGFVTDRLPTPDQAPAFIADSLLAWRRWLESLAERFDRILPLPESARAASAADVVAEWEAAITQLVTFALAPVVDHDGWSGWCDIVLKWFLTATGVPPEQAQTLLDDAVGRRFDHWVPLTAADIGDVAERLARDVLGPVGVVPAAGIDNWPDTWPSGWPSWRSTNIGRDAR
jgi:hypothetical protein